MTEGPVRAATWCAILGATLTGCGGVTATASGPGPASVQELCDGQAWPRPLPEVTGRIVAAFHLGDLGCFSEVTGHAADGDDPLGQTTGPAGTFRIVAMSPPAGTPVAAHDPVTVELVPVDPQDAPASRPCDWVTADEAERLLGTAPVITTPRWDQQGSVDQRCTYTAGLREVTSELKLPGAFYVDAQADTDMTVNLFRGTEATGLPGRAYWIHTQGSAGHSDEFRVLLSGGRVYSVAGRDLTTIDPLKAFARTAIGRLGA